jgi:CBS domain-containing protein
MVAEIEYSPYLAGMGMTVEQALREERLKSLPLPRPVCVPAGTSLEATLRIMRDRGVGCVLVYEGERLAGIFTERDVLNKVLAKKVSENEPVDRFMTRDPAVLGLQDTLGDAVRLMNRCGHRHIPLLDEDHGKAGLVAAADIVRYIAEHFPGEVVNLPPRLHQSFNTPEGA